MSLDLSPPTKDNFSGENEYHVASFVAHAMATRLSEVHEAINQIKDAEIHATSPEGKIVFTAEADAIIAKGIIALLIGVLSNETAEDILNTELNFIKEIGLQDHLSPTRANGLLGMIKQIKTYALIYAKKG